MAKRVTEGRWQSIAGLQSGSSRTQIGKEPRTLFLRHALAALAMLAGLLWAAAPVAAYSILHRHYPAEMRPQAALTADGLGNLYGTTPEGGLLGGGTVFKMKPDGTGYQTLHTFKGGPNDGMNPRASLILDGSGNLYGTTERGGASYQSGGGTVFKMKTDGTGFELLHKWEITTGEPQASLVLDGSGNLYGTTKNGGAPFGHGGSIFKMKTNGTGYETLHAFSGTASDGDTPYAALVLDGAGNLYGTTDETGPGRVFKIKTDGTGFQLLHSFYGDFSDGIGSGHPASLILDGAGNLYGTTNGDYGTVFKGKTDGTGFQVLHKFTGGANDGRWPAAALISDDAGNLYGTTSGGGSGEQGTVFKLKMDGTAFQLLHKFTGGPTEGNRPLAALILDGSGILYGTTYSGGASNGGTAFTMKTDGTAFRLLHTFAGHAADGRWSTASLMMDGSGNLYGTTEYGGSSDSGTVFSMKRDGTGFQLLHSFTGRASDGSNPKSSLILDGAGYLYGTTNGDYYGIYGYGTVFRMKTDGTGFQLLHSFPLDSTAGGSRPLGALILDSVGNLYGTTTSGGSSGNGTVFTMKTDGTGFQVLHSFNRSDGAGPQGSLILDSSENLYGTTLSGGPSDRGTVFTMKTDGTGFLLLHSFTVLGGAGDGKFPRSSLILDDSGNLYGTTPEGGSSDAGTVFKVRTDGEGFQVLRSFKGGARDGNSPYTSLIMDGAGNLYGTTSQGGTGYCSYNSRTGTYAGCGTAFTMKRDGTGFQLLYSFEGNGTDDNHPLGTRTDGSTPLASLITDGSGNFYGTTKYGGYGGSPGNGTVFTLVAYSGPPPAPTVTMTSGTNPVCAGARVTLDAGAGYGSYSWSTGATTRTITVSPANTTTYSVRVTAPGRTDLSPAGSLTVTVNPIPGTPVATNDGPKCEGGTVQLSTGSVTGAAYRWTGPGGFTSSTNLPTLANVTQAMAGDYSVTVTLEGCTSAAGKTAVVVRPRPAKPVVSAPAAAKMAQAFIASVPPSAGIAYQWTVIGNGTLTSGQGTASITVTAGNEGTLTVKVTATNTLGCASQESSVQVTVFDPAKFLVLQGGKVSVKVEWRNQYSGQTGVATAIPKADQYGYLYFSNANNPEVFVKVLDFGSSSPYLLFWAGLTDFEYNITFTNTATGTSASFNKPSGSTDGGANTTSLPHVRAVLWNIKTNTAKSLSQHREIASTVLEEIREEGDSEAAEAVSLYETVQGLPGPAAAGEILLTNGQVAVTVTWKSQYTGETGTATPIPQKDEFCFFFFSNEENPEVFVKALDWGAPGPFKLFAAGLTDFEYSVTFRNVKTGLSAVFKKSAGTYSGYAANMER